MKPIFTGLGALALLFVMSFAPPAAHAQTASTAARVENLFSYDVNREVTLSGTVSSVLAKPSPGMLWGSHLLLATGSGEVDASLGMWGLQGRGAISVEAGQQIEMTGVMKTIRNRQVFMARTVKVQERIYAIRNKHGVPVPPQSRERISQKTDQEGETQ